MEKMPFPFDEFPEDRSTWEQAVLEYKKLKDELKKATGLLQMYLDAVGASEINYVDKQNYEFLQNIKGKRLNIEA